MAVIPSSGSSAGGTVVTLRGSNFDAVGTHLLCSFAIGGRASLVLNGDQWSGRADVVDATRDSDTTMRCHSPRSPNYVKLPNITISSPSMPPPVLPPLGPPKLPPPVNGTNVTAINANTSAATNETSTSQQVIASNMSTESSGEAQSGDAGSGSGGDFASGSGDFSSGSGDFGSGSGAFEDTNVSSPMWITYMDVAATEVALNGRQFVEPALPFTYFGTPVISSFSPSCGPTHGDTLVSVTGYHFRYGSAYRCRFDDLAVEASFYGSVADPHGTLRCVSPHGLQPGIRSLEVSLNAQDFTANTTMLFAAYTPPTVTELIPHSGSSGGDTLVRVVHGSELGCDYRCAFGNQSEVVVAASTGAMGQTVTCKSPSLHAIQPGLDGSADGNYAVEVTLNGQQYSAEGKRPFDFFEPRVSALVPAFGPVGNATLIVVRGQHFSARLRATFAGLATRCQCNPQKQQRDRLYTRADAEQCLLKSYWRSRSMVGITLRTRSLSTTRTSPESRRSHQVLVRHWVAL